MARLAAGGALAFAHAACTWVGETGRASADVVRRSAEDTTLGPPYAARRIWLLLGFIRWCFGSARGGVLAGGIGAQGTDGVAGFG
jgi:hypothetical protein